MINLDSEFSSPGKEFFLGAFATGRIKHTDADEIHPLLILRIEPANKYPGAGCFKYDGNTMQLIVAGMKDVSTHGQTDTPQNLSKASLRAAATAWGDLPSIMWR